MVYWILGFIIRKTLSSNQIIIEHVLINIIKEERSQYKCNQEGCEKIYYYYSSLRKHIRKSHKESAVPQLPEMAPVLKNEQSKSSNGSNNSRKNKIREGKHSLFTLCCLIIFLLGYKFCDVY